MLNRRSLRFHFILFSYITDSINSLQTQNEEEFHEQICALSPGREETVEHIGSDNENQAINQLYSIEL